MGPLAKRQYRAECAVVCCLTVTVYLALACAAIAMFNPRLTVLPTANDGASIEDAWDTFTALKNAGNKLFKAKRFKAAVSSVRKRAVTAPTHNNTTPLIKGTLTPC